MRTLLLLILLNAGCASNRGPHPHDTILLESQRNWLEIYGKELKVAIKNSDDDAFRFFWPEYLKELDKSRQSPIIIRVTVD